MKVWAADENDSGYSTPLLEDVFGKASCDIKKEFHQFIDEIEKEEDYVDAYRISVLDKESLELYKTFNTCCGSTDIVKEVKGIKYMFGCNYGH